MSTFTYITTLLCAVVAAYHCWTGHRWYKKGDVQKAIYYVLVGIYFLVVATR
ncbi:hypothetical protein P9G84_23730 [Brevibacillus centrosporus]|uniref:hypothetical protein n=1 Tax=Brevibacillus centrosporus TaxID=54910 RepID=UPI001168D25F|nr:hypothetical protein [Brevibacillus centrosporus]MEC2131928.1 hypothetical protein [Brevibacillus centrosporus]GED35094.1 hypothetical protein BCE02nite_62350 [Brevibacillus centrosporus]